MHECCLFVSNNENVFPTMKYRLIRVIIHVLREPLEMKMLNILQMGGAKEKLMLQMIKRYTRQTGL